MFTIKFNLWIGLGLAIALVGCGPVGPLRHEVQGEVLVDGQPAERVMVQFHAVNEELQGDDRYPVAITDAQGKFRINDGAHHPGAIEGLYRVTFSWLSSPGLDAVDKFKGAYAEVESSKYEVEVPPARELSFSLQTPRS
jgi:hypothetical protein